MNIKNLIFWSLIGFAIGYSSQCAWTENTSATQLDGHPDNLSQLSRCEATCIDLRNSCPLNIDYGACISNCSDISNEADLLLLERSNKCFSQNSRCDPTIYASTCIMDGGH